LINIKQSGRLFLIWVPLKRITDQPWREVVVSFAIPGEGVRKCMVSLSVTFDINVPFFAKNTKIKTVELPPCFYIELSFRLDIVSFQRLIHYVFERAGLLQIIYLPGTHQFRVGRRDMNYPSPSLAGNPAGQSSDLSQLDPGVRMALKHDFRGKIGLLRPEKRG